MKKIIEHLEAQIPKGHWCEGCPYFEIKEITMTINGRIRHWFCNLSEEYINRKECEINNK
jgi:hypothetical protein